jgi:hypothetical protein
MDARIKSAHALLNRRTCMMRRLARIALGLFLLTAGSANAQDGPVGFKTPSGNIFCRMFDFEGPPTLRCDMMEVDTRPRRPASCDGDWGRAFEMTARGRAAPICRGDTMYDPSLPALRYGSVWQRAGFTCRSEQTGLTCFNASGRGFSLSRARQEVF